MLASPLYYCDMEAPPECHSKSDSVRESNHGATVRLTHTFSEEAGMFPPTKPRPQIVLTSMSQAEGPPFHLVTAARCLWRGDEIALAR